MTGPVHAPAHGAVESNQEQVPAQAPAQVPAHVAAPAKQAQAYRCVHTHGLHYEGQDYHTGQRYVFTPDQLHEGGWLDSQIKAKLFEPTE
jgi:hypothetical protein